jgi:hypothetical protein
MLQKTGSRLIQFIRQDRYFPLILLMVILGGFSLQMPWLGFQGDDWHMVWLQYRFGSLNAFFNLTRFSTQWAFQMVMPWMAPVPWQWFLLTLLLRWLSGISLYLFFEKLLPKQKEQAGIFSLLYCLYPGFLMGYLPVTFLAQFIQPGCLFISLYFMVVWLENDQSHNRSFLILSLLFSATNLLLSEYFFFLELLRPLIIWIILRRTGKKHGSFMELIQFWKYFLAVFLFIFGVRVHTQVQSRGRAMLTLEKFNLQPISFIFQWLQQVARDFYAIILQPFIASLTPHFDLQSAQGMLLLSGAVVVAVIIFLYLFKHTALPPKTKSNPFRLMAFGMIVFFLAALPFWMAGLKSFFGFEMLNRVALPQGLSFTILLFSLLSLVPSRWKVMNAGLIALLAGSFAFLQLQSAERFRAEWDTQRRLMWQLAWRAPRMEAGTVMLMNNPGFLLSGENSLSAELNWNYVDAPHPGQADYFVYFNEHRFLADFGDVHADRIFRQDHMLGPVALNPSRLLVIHFSPSGCLRVLDPQIDPLDSRITDFTRGYIQYADLSVIQANSAAESRRLDPVIYRDEPAHDWCYYFQKTDLARQLGDWPSAEEYARQGLAQMPANPDPAELRPFIETLAQSDEWSQAKQLTEDLLARSASQARILCTLWQRIARTTHASLLKQESLAWMTARTGCNVQ